MRIGARDAPLLLIEEDPGLRSLFTDLLTAEGYDLVCAGSLEESFRRVEEQSFALILADVSLRRGSPDLARAHALRARIYPVPLALLVRLPLPPTAKQADFAFVLPMPFEIEDCLRLIASTVPPPLSAEQQAISRGDWREAGGSRAALHPDCRPSAVGGLHPSPRLPGLCMRSSGDRSGFSSSAEMKRVSFGFQSLANE